MISGSFFSENFVPSFMTSQVRLGNLVGTLQSQVAKVAAIFKHCEEEKALGLSFDVYEGEIYQEGFFLGSKEE